MQSTAIRILLIPSLASATRQIHIGEVKPHAGGAARLSPLITDQTEIPRSGFAAIIHRVVADVIAFVKTVKTRSFDRTDVNEHVFAPLIGLNEAIALLGVEPFDFAGSHLEVSLKCGVRGE